MKKKIKPLAAASAVALVWLAACSSDQTDATHAALADGCYINTDCNSPLVCAFRRCHAECQSTRDCPGGARCVASDRPFHVCQLGVEKNCSYNSDCPTGQVCGVDQNCRDQCKSNSDCVTGQFCAQGTCAEPAELRDGHLIATGTPPGGADAATIGQSCQYNSDCPTALICQNQVCIAECKVDVDCRGLGLGLRCVDNQCTGAGTSGDAGTQDASIKGCSYNSDCTPQICRNGACIDQCHADVDCGLGQTCNASHVCTSSFDAATPPDAPAGYGNACAYNSDCPVPLVCKPSGTCAYECITHNDCPANSFCSGGNVCLVGPRLTDAGAVDANQTDTGAGKACSDNASCSDGLFCNGVEQCVAGHCAPAADTPCNSHTSCMQDTCDEQNKSCSHQTLAPVDADGDGHLDFGCGGDDCNDKDSSIYTGHAELCDGKDNDCNGLVDDYAVVARGPEYTSVSAAAGGRRNLITTAFGAGLITGKLYFPNSTHIMVQTMSTAGVAGAEIDASGQLINYSSYSTLVGMGGNTLASPAAVVVYDTDVGNFANMPRYATVVRPVPGDGGTTLATTTPITLYAAQAQAGDADVDWTGQDFLVTWGRGNGNFLDGYFTTIGTDGSQTTSSLAVPSVSGHVGNNTTSPVRLRAAANGSIYAFSYGQWTTNYTVATNTLYLTSASGSIVAGPLSLPGAPLDVAPYQTGFVVISQASDALYLTKISSTGTVLATQKASTLGSATILATDARGASDAQGIAFVVKVADGVRLVRARTNLADPLEISVPMTPAFVGASDRVDLSLLADGTLGVSYWETAAGNAVHTRIVSCLP